MGKKRKCKPPVIPQQDKRICGSICFCQMIVVFSCVSLIYLTVAVYIPSYKAFHSGYETTPAMCQTINTSLINNCSWASCSEWCLTKASGFCPQIHVTTRQNGTELELRNCTRFTTINCPQVTTANLKRYNCNNGTECATLNGVFNCSLGHCRNHSEIYQCHHHADGAVLDSDKDNTKMTGFFECRGSKCVKIKRKFSCDRYCPAIMTNFSSNVFITQDDSVHTMVCASAWAFTESRGNEPRVEIEEELIWEARKGEVLMISCHSLKHNSSSIRGIDCVNGTIYNTTEFPTPSMNFTQFWRLRNRLHRLLDPAQRFVPPQAALTIFNHSRLFINLDGCVNTLRGECREFLQTNGRDGRNQTAQSRFPCFYNKNNSERVVARYDLHTTWRQFVIAATVPSVLFVVSFLTLCIIMQSVRVGDDTKMRCKYCLGNTEDPDLLTTTTPTEGGGTINGGGVANRRGDITASQTYETDINLILHALNEQ